MSIFRNILPNRQIRIPRAVKDPLYSDRLIATKKMRNPKTKRLTPRLTPEFQLQVQIAAQNLGINTHELARRALSEYIEKLKNPQQMAV